MRMKVLSLSTARRMIMIQLVLLFTLAVSWKPKVIRDELIYGPRSWDVIRTEELPKNFDLYLALLHPHG